MDATHTPALLAHSWLRWLVVGMLALVVVRAALRRSKGEPWNKTDEGMHAGAVGLLDLQFTVGLWLYVFTSPFAQAFFAAPGTAMRDSVLRFFGLEHVVMMTLGLAAVHIGRARSKRQVDGRRRNRVVFAWTLAGLLLILAGVPWPFRQAVGRPLLRTSEARVEHGTMSAAVVRPGSPRR